MEALSKTKAVIQWLTRFICFCGMLLLLPMMLLTSFDVIGRAVWSRPIPGVVELSSYLLAIFILTGVAYTQQEKGHVAVTMFTSRLPQKSGLILEMVTTLMSLFIIAIMTWQGWVVGMEEKSVSDMLRIPQMPFKLLVSLAGLFLFLELVIDLCQSAARLARR